MATLHRLEEPSIGVQGLRDRPLLERKRRLRAIIYHEHIDGRGVALFDAVGGKDLEGLVAAATTRTGRRRRG